MKDSLSARIAKHGSCALILGALVFTAVTLTSRLIEARVTEVAGHDVTVQTVSLPR